MIKFESNSINTKLQKNHFLSIEKNSLTNPKLSYQLIMSYNKDFKGVGLNLLWPLMYHLTNLRMCNKPKLWIQMHGITRSFTQHEQGFTTLLFHHPCYPSIL